MYLLWLTSNNFVFQLRLTIFVMFETMCFKKSVRSVCLICLPDKWGWEVHWWSSYLHITSHQYKNTTHTSVYQLTIVTSVGAFYFATLTTTMHENQKMTINVYFWRLLPTYKFNAALLRNALWCPVIFYWLFITSFITSNTVVSSQDICNIWRLHSSKPYLSWLCSNGIIRCATCRERSSGKESKWRSCTFECSLSGVPPIWSEWDLWLLKHTILQIKMWYSTLIHTLIKLIFLEC